MEVSPHIPDVMSDLTNATSLMEIKAKPDPIDFELAKLARQMDDATLAAEACQGIKHSEVMNERCCCKERYDLDVSDDQALDLKYISKDGVTRHCANKVDWFWHRIQKNAISATCVKRPVKAKLAPIIEEMKDQVESKHHSAIRLHLKKKVCHKARVARDLTTHPSPLCCCGKGKMFNNMDDTQRKVYTQRVEIDRGYNIFRKHKGFEERLCVPLESSAFMKFMEGRVERDEPLPECN